MCLRYAIKMINNGLNDIAEKYLLIAPAFKRAVIEGDLYKELKNLIYTTRRSIKKTKRQ